MLDSNGPGRRGGFFRKNRPDGSQKLHRLAATTQGYPWPEDA